jgi:hypothetical protein
MIKVKDDTGNIVPGLLKSSHGALVVQPDTAYDRYKKEKELSLEITNLKSEMADIKAMLLILVNKQ